MASKTRDKLIEVAKQLFIRKGVENTTINDIANASDKGRRTIYTYFKNKREIYRAVIERESDMMVHELRQVVASADSPTEKLRKFITLRVAQTKNASSPYSAIRFLSSIDFGRNERVRKLAHEKEVAMLNTIIDQGISCGEFDAQRSQCLRNCLYSIIRTADFAGAATSDDAATSPDKDFGPSLAQFTINAIKTN